MSATQGNISGTGTGNTVVATSFINSGAISICCNADGKVSIRSNNGSFTFYTQASESSALSQVGGSPEGPGALSSTTPANDMVASPNGNCKYALISL